jgi:SMC interacting uncharacterized protein involved in chromosome segregation
MFGISKYFLIGAGVIISILLGLLAFEKYTSAKLETKVANLEKAAIADQLEISSLEDELTGVQFKLTLAENGREFALKREAEAEADRAEYEKLLKDILDAKDEDDGPVAPVLERVVTDRVSND